jgi:hypothetical protein
MRRLGLLLLVSMLASGCVMVTLVEPRPTSIGDTYTVEPQIRWASVPARPGLEVWTVDGTALDAITFVKGLADGAVLLRGVIQGGPPEDRRPKFRARMTPNEIAELVVDSYALFGAQKIETSNLRPATFGSADGFRFDMGWITRSGLEMQALAAGAVIKDRLHLIIYAGARAHYFPKYRDDVDRVLASVRLQ